MVQEQLSRHIPTALTVQDAITEFMLHQKASRHSPNTLHSYEYALGRLENWLALQGITTFDGIDPKALRAFMVQLEDLGLAPNSIHLIMRAVRALCRFLEREELILKSPMARVTMPRVDKRILPAFTDSEVSKLLGACSGADWLSVRNHALILFLLDSGVRLHECSALTVDSIDRQTGVMRIMGKGRRERITRVGAKTLRAMNRYLRARDAEPGGALWVGIKGPMTSWGIAETLEKLGKRAGVHAHPHKFRRTCALMLLRNGADVFSVQHLLGHSDLTVLRRYLAQTEIDVARSHELNSPVDRM